jgi:hypothetical protein
VCELSPGNMQFADLLRDPLTRLVMRSDGVTKREMILLSRRIRSALAARDSMNGFDLGKAGAFGADRQRSATFEPSV